MDSSPLLVVGAWLFTYLLHSSVLLGVTGLVVHVAPRRTARFAETMWRVALFGGVLTASAALLLSNVSPSLLRLGVIETSASSSLSARRVLWLEGPSAAAFVESAATVVAVAVTLWFAVVMLRLSSLIYAHRRFHRSLAGRTPLLDPTIVCRVNAWCAGRKRDGTVRLSVSRSIDTPIALGANEVCLPARALASFSRAELDAALAHEVAHLVRRDTFWLMLSALVERVLFVQPLNRVAGQRLRALAELACDDWALQRTGNPVALASALTHVTGWISGNRGYALAVGMASPQVRRESLAVARVRRILDPAASRPVRQQSRARASLATFALSAVVLLVPHVSPAAMQGRHASDLSSPRAQYTINAHDDAGPFNLTLRGGRVIAATVNGASVAAAHIQHDGNRVHISDVRGGAPLDLTLTESGGISWTSRPALLALGH